MFPYKNLQLCWIRRILFKIRESLRRNNTCESVIMITCTHLDKIDWRELYTAAMNPPMKRAPKVPTTSTMVVSEILEGRTHKSRFIYIYPDSVSCRGTTGNIPHFISFLFPKAQPVTETEKG